MYGEINMHVEPDGRLTCDSETRKALPLATGLLDYFPDALVDVARLSRIGNDKHNPGQPLHWSRGKANDHADCIMRHMIDRGSVDVDGVLHDTKVAWRALAQLQLAIERRRSTPQASTAASPTAASPNAASPNAASRPFTYWYLATPYTKFAGGLEAAAMLAYRLTAQLMRAGVPVFCPIAHTHPVAAAELRDKQTDHGFWMRADGPMMEAAGGLLVALVPGWGESHGVRFETEQFRHAGKPVMFWDPDRSLPAILAATVIE